MLQSRKVAFAKGTISNLSIQWKAYLLFCAYYQLHPFKISINVLCCYCQFLSRSFKSVCSIKNYLNGVRILFLLQGMEINKFSSFELKLTLRGLSRVLQHLPKQALPITLEILEKIHKYLNFKISEDVTFWCLFLFAFFLLSRKSNLVPISSRKFDNTKQLCRKDIIIQKSYLLVKFKWTKTIQFGDRVLYIPLVAIPSSKFCPVSAYKRMCEFIPASTESPAFLIESRGKLIPLAYNQFQNKLKQLISLIGLNPLLFSSHSFRRGGATLLANAGIPSNMIQLMGDWKSDAYKKYIVNDLSDRLKVANKIKKIVICHER